MLLCSFVAERVEVAVRTIEFEERVVDGVSDGGGVEGVDFGGVDVKVLFDGDDDSLPFLVGVGGGGWHGVWWLLS